MRFVIALFLAFLAPLAAFAEKIDQDGWAGHKKYVKLDNRQKLAVVDYGNPDGRPVILLHGLTDTSRSWTQLLPALSEFRVVIPDQRGHGAAAKPECCYSLDDYAYDLKLLMDAMKIERAAIVGHSLGSLVAMEFAATHPDRVERLVLAGSTGKAPATADDWLAQGALAMRDPIDQSGEFITAWFNVDSVVRTPVDRGFLDHVFREGRSTPASVWRGVIRGVIDLDAARFAAEIDAPMLILAGGKDELFGAEHQSALRGAFPDAAYVEFDGLGHNFIWEETARVAPPLVEFLRAQSAD